MKKALTWIGVIIFIILIILLAILGIHYAEKIFPIAILIFVAYYILKDIAR